VSFAERNQRWLLPSLAVALAGVVWMNLPARSEGSGPAPASAAAPAAEAPPGAAQSGPVPVTAEDPAHLDNDVLPLLLAGRQPLTPQQRAGTAAPVLHPERWAGLGGAPAPVPGPVSAPRPGPLQPPGELEFLLLSGPRREAWVGGRAYRVGDTLEGGYRLQRINETGVVLSGPSGELRLPIGSGAAAARTPPTGGPP